MYKWRCCHGLQHCYGCVSHSIKSSGFNWYICCCSLWLPVVLLGSSSVWIKAQNKSEVSAQHIFHQSWWCFSRNVSLVTLYRTNEYYWTYGTDSLQSANDPSLTSLISFQEFKAGRKSLAEYQQQPRNVGVPRPCFQPHGHHFLLKMQVWNRKVTLLLLVMWSNLYKQ